MIDGENLPDVEPGQFSTPPDQKGPTQTSSSCLSWGIALTGGLILMIGCALAFAATFIQFDRQGDWEGFFAFVLFCPTPLMVVGLIILIAGALPLLRARQIEER